MTPRLLSQLAWVAFRDAHAEMDLDEAQRLQVVGYRLAYRARCKGQTNQGIDAVFGPEGDE